MQRYITEYRTNKARHDLQYFKQLTVEAKHEYEKERQLYGSYSDANTDVVLQSFRSKQEDLENDMQLKFNAVPFRMRHGTVYRENIVITANMDKPADNLDTDIYRMLLSEIYETGIVRERYAYA